MRCQRYHGPSTTQLSIKMTNSNQSTTFNCSSKFLKVTGERVRSLLFLQEKMKISMSWYVAVKENIDKMTPHIQISLPVFVIVISRCLKACWRQYETKGRSKTSRCWPPEEEHSKDSWVDQINFWQYQTFWVLWQSQSWSAHDVREDTVHEF